MEDVKTFRCTICNRTFTRSNNLKKHIKIKHDHISLDFSCYLCRKNFKDQEKYLLHIDSHKEGLSFVLYKKLLKEQYKYFENTLNFFFHLPIF